jgi:RimJ/RimL family protein N-acetyltransferase
LSIEVRFGVLSPIAQGAGYAFDLVHVVCDTFFRQGYRRVHTWSNVANIKSMFFHPRAGYTFEGVVRSSIISRGNNMDIAVFRALDFEWPEMKKDLLKKIEASIKKNPRL